MTTVEPGHRKLIEHRDLPKQAHELTFSCLERRPLLVHTQFKALLAAGIDAACSRHRFNLLAYVFMPEHVHLLVYPTEEQYSTAALLYAIKRPVSYRIKRILEASERPNARPLLDSLTVRERPGKNCFKFWLEGPGYDRNVMNRYVAISSLHYIHDNPVKRGLVEHPRDWEWSSWRNYFDPKRARDHPAVDTTMFGGVESRKS